MEDNTAGLAKPSLRKTGSSALDSFPVLGHCPASVPPSNFFFPSSLFELGLPGGSMAKNLPEMQETWVQSLGGKDPLEKGMATHSCFLAWKNPMDRGARWAAVHENLLA